MRVCSSISLCPFGSKLIPCCRDLQLPLCYSKQGSTTEKVNELCSSPTPAPSPTPAAAPFNASVYLVLFPQAPLGHSRS